VCTAMLSLGGKRVAREQRTDTTPWEQQMANDIEELTSRNEPCSVEIFRRGAPGDVKIWYWVAESHPTDDIPYPDPVDIIAWDETVYVIVYVLMGDAVRRHLCGRLCVDIDVDTCGPAPDLQFDEKELELDPCGDGRYRIVFTLPPYTFQPPPERPARCGRVYRLCVTVGSHDACGNPGLIWGHCDSVEIAVHPPVTQ
jgi:hypothetical protein